MGGGEWKSGGKDQEGKKTRKTPKTNNNLRGWLLRRGRRDCTHHKWLHEATALLAVHLPYFVVLEFMNI